MAAVKHGFFVEAGSNFIETDHVAEIFDGSSLQQGQEVVEAFLGPGAGQENQADPKLRQASKKFGKAQVEAHGQTDFSPRAGKGDHAVSGLKAPRFAAVGEQVDLAIRG